ncbi:2-C-methyl-D-erythritol 4-phosphate cytidylyltransferase [Thalassococcus sp. BH17M4-6]|uniref:2-C-methyl-D-erythritol 4-phosphate cytidylyltransferase n=1 Tax=Thalassococcus sp. BH17M4-6 TaxID=3413148 RepID=UPI003BDA402A
MPETSQPKARHSVGVVLVAAGRGRRLGGETPKQYLALGRHCALRRSAGLFLSIEAVSCVVPVIHPDDSALYDAAMAGLTDARLHAPVHGGDTRAASVRRGLEALRSASPDLVLIHDAARPFVPPQVIADVIAALEISVGACAALPVVDALWRADGNRADTPVPRDGLWRAQTPQGFDFARILAAHEQHDGTGADDVAVARDAGIEVTFVQGSEQSYKITTADDLARARADAARIDAKADETP